MKHGQSDNTGGRYCHKHGLHGGLYICPEYPQALKDQLLKDAEDFREKIKTGEAIFIINGQRVKLKDLVGVMSHE